MRRRAVAGRTAGQRLRAAFQPLADRGDSALTFLVADFLVGAAEDEEHAARDDFGGVGVEEVMAQHRQFVVFLG